MKFGIGKSPFGIGVIIYATNKADTWGFAFGISTKLRVRTSRGHFKTIYWGRHKDVGARDIMRVYAAWPFLFGTAKRGRK